MTKKVQRLLACTGAAAVLAAVPLLLLAEPAQAWPSTVVICNDDNSSGTTPNFDVNRISPGAAYANELIPGECTAALGEVQYLRLDLTDDGANTQLDSIHQGAIDDTYDDNEGPYDPGCLDTNTVSDDAARPLNATLADHVPNGIRIRLRDSVLCGDDSNAIRVCNDAASVSNFDMRKIDDSYFNQLVPGECSNFKDAVGSNPLAIDLFDGGAHTVREWKWKDTSAGTWSACEREKTANIDSDPDPTISDEEILDFNAEDSAFIGERTVRVYADGTAGGTRCGVTATGDAPAEVPSEAAAGLPTDAASDAAEAPAWASDNPTAPLEG
jgi:hypothetical protein